MHHLLNLLEVSSHPAGRWMLVPALRARGRFPGVHAGPGWVRPGPPQSDAPPSPSRHPARSRSPHAPSLPLPHRRPTPSNQPTLPTTSPPVPLEVRQRCVLRPPFCSEQQTAATAHSYTCPQSPTLGPLTPGPSVPAPLAGGKPLCWAARGLPSLPLYSKPSPIHDPSSRPLAPPALQALQLLIN